MTTIKRVTVAVSIVILAAGLTVALHARGEWPNVQNPFWGTEPFWTASADTDTGLRTNRELRLRAQRDRDEALRFEERRRYDRDRYGRDRDTTYRQRYDRAERDRADRVGQRRVFKGEIVEIDPESRTMVVESDSRVMHFEFDDRPVLALKNMRNPSIADLRVGYHVSVGYFESAGGDYIAKSIIRTDASELR